MILGPSVFPVKSVPAGNIVGIVGLEDHVLKTGTLCSTWACLPMTPITFQAKPMVRVAVEPLSHQDLPKLESGLRSLYQYDPAVEVGIDDSGQHTMTCLGELHLEQCLKYLVEKFAKCELRASEPIVPFRETILSCDVNYRPQKLPPPWTEVAGITDLSACGGRCRFLSVNGHLAFTVRSFPLPAEFAEILENDVLVSAALSLHMQTKELGNGALTQNEKELLMKLVRVLASLDDGSIDSAINFHSTNPEDRDEVSDDLNITTLRAMELFSKLIALGPRNSCSNLILQSSHLRIEVLDGHLPITRNLCSCEKTEEFDCQDTRHLLFLSRNHELFSKIWYRVQSAISAGFQVATNAGPLMQEPMYRVGFVIEKIEVTELVTQSVSISTQDLINAIKSNTSEEDEKLLSLIDLSDISSRLLSQQGSLDAAVSSSVLQLGQLISDISAALRLSFLLSPTRLVEPIYACYLQCDQMQLGNLYGVLAKRRGEILREDIIEGTSLFLLEATLPVVESFGFAQELLKV